MKVDLYITNLTAVGTTCKVWGQDDTEKCQDIEHLLETVETDEELQHVKNENSVVPGSLILGKYSEDMRWYRAKVVEVHGAKDSAKVQFLDFGNIEELAFEDLRFGGSKYFRHPPQGKQYVVADIYPKKESWNDEEIGILTEHLVYAELSGELLGNFLPGAPTLIRLYDGLGTTNPIIPQLVEKGAGLSVRSEKNKCFVNLAAMGVGSKHHVYVSYIDTSLSFWIQEAISANHLDVLHETIESDVNRTPLKVFTPGAYCLALFSETETYYRAIILDVLQDNQCFVMFIDYGNTENVSNSNIMTLTDAYSQLPAQGIPCALEEPIDISLLNTYPELETAYAEIKSVTKDGVHIVKLFDCEEKYPKSSDNEIALGSQGVLKTDNAATNHVICISPVLFDIGQFADVTISSVEKSGHFFCQLNKNVIALDGLMHELQSPYKSQPNMRNPTEGKYCVVVTDNIFYRAQLVNVDGNQVKVRHIDFGSYDTVSVSSLYDILPSHASLPMQAIFCSLSGSEKYPVEEVYDLLCKYDSKIPLVCKVNIKTPNMYDLELFDTRTASDITICDLLRKDYISASDTSRDNITNLSIPPPNIDNQRNEKVYVTAITSSVEFFAQLSKYSPEALDDMQQELASYYENAKGKLKPLYDVQAQGLCATTFSEDGGWYRAQVTSISGGTADVQYVDYGNGESKSLPELFPLHENFCKLPRQGVWCTLDNLKSQGKELLEEILLEKEIMIHATSMLSGCRATVSLPQILENEDVLTKLEFSPVTKNVAGGRSPPRMSPNNNPRNVSSESTSTRTKEIQPQENRSAERSENTEKKKWAKWGESGRTKLDYSYEDFAPNKYIDVFVCYAFNPGKFWCQKVAATSQLETLMGNLNGDYARLKKLDMLLSGPTVGQPCCAMFSEDGCWYRSKVIEVEGKTATVQFVDYGNSELMEIAMLKELKPQYLSNPAMAFECCLDNLEPLESKWSAESIAEFEKLVSEKNLVGCIINKRGENEFSIELLDTRQGQQVSIHDALVQKGVAKSQNPVEIFQAKSSRVSQSRRTSGSSTSSRGSVKIQPAARDIQELSIQDGTFVDVNVVFVSNPSQFWCQMTEQSSQIDALMTEMGQYYGNLSNAELRMVSPQVGQVCCAKFSEDEEWYRGKIMKVERSQIKVKFVDYGNGEWLSKDSVKNLSVKFLQLPAQAIQMTLNELRPAIGDLWVDESVHYFEDITRDKNLIAEIKGKSCVGSYCVELTEATSGNKKEIGVSHQLVDMGVAVQGALSLSALQGKCASPAKGKKTQDSKIESYKKVQISAGESYEVCVSWVNNPKEFWCYLNQNDDDLQKLMDDMFEFYQSLKLSDLAIDNPQTEQPCVALYEADGGWYRGIIRDNKEGEANVYYVDFGNSNLVRMSKVKQIKPEYMVLPAQAIKCSLKGVEPPCGRWQRKAIEAFNLLVKLTSVKCKFITEMPDVMIVDLEDEKGQDLSTRLIESGTVRPAGRPTSVVSKESAVPPPPTPTSPAKKEVIEENNYSYKNVTLGEGQHVKVMVSHIESPLEFYCHKLDTSNNLDMMMEKLENHYALLDEGVDTLNELKVGVCCVAKFSEDDAWYRSIITKVEDTDNAWVTFVDYGNSEKAPRKKLKNLAAEFEVLPAQAIRCTLSDISKAGNEAVLEAFSDHVLDKQLNAVVVKFNGNIAQVELIDAANGDFNINQNLASVLDDLSSSSAESSIQERKETIVEDIPSHVILSNQKMDAFVSHLNSPTSFYIQLADLEAEIADFADKITAEYDRLGPEERSLQTYTSGTLCCAKFSEDGAWYRAKITTSGDDTVGVHFLDYGNVDTVSKTEVKQLEGCYLTQTKYAYHCTLSEVICPEEGWTEDDIAKFEEVTNDALLRIEFVNDCNVKRETVLWKEDALISTLFAETQSEGASSNVEVVEENQIKETTTSSSQEVEQADEDEPEEYFQNQRLKGRVKLYVCNVETPEKFFVQLESQEEELNILLASLEVPQSFEKLPDPLVAGDICAGQSSADDAWYRATISTIEGTTATVHFMDYGNNEELDINRLRGLRKQLMELTPFSYECKLKLSNQDQILWTDDDIEQFASLTQDQLMTADILSDDGKVYLVQLANGDIDVNEILERKTTMQPDTNVVKEEDPEKETGSEYPPSNIPKGQCDVFISHADSPSCFYLHLASQEESLEEITTALEKGQFEERVERPRIGQPCIVQYSQDEAWYRALVTDLNETSATVRFVDFGNSEEVPTDELRRLPQNLMEKAPFAVECKLKLDNEDQISWTDGEIEQFSSLTQDCQLTANILSEKRDVFHVQLTNEDVNVNEKFNGKAAQTDVGAVKEDNTSAEKEEASSIASDVKEEASSSASASAVKEEDSPSAEKEEDSPSEKDTSSFKEYPSLSLHKGQCRVYVSHADSPSCFYVHLDSQEDKLEGITTKLEKGNFEEKVEDPRIGHPCIVKFSEDEAWYRALIIDINDANAKVRFVDFGNSENVVDAELRKIPEEFLIDAPFAIQCKLNSTEEPTDGWLQEDIEKFRTLTAGEDPLDAVILSGGEPFSINLNNCETNINQKFGVKGTDLEHEAAEGIEATEDLGFPEVELPSEEVDCIVSSVITPSLFYVQLNSSEKEMSTLQDRLQLAYSIVDHVQQIETLKEGRVCCAKFAEDELWYRGVIKSIGEEGVSVMFVDYGNTEIVKKEDLKRLSEEFCEHPPFAIECQLDGIENKTWADEEIDLFVETTQDITVKATFREREHTSYVVLMDSEGSVSRIFKKQEESESVEVEAGSIENIGNDDLQEQDSNTPEGTTPTENITPKDETNAPEENSLTEDQNTEDSNVENRDSGSERLSPPKIEVSDEMNGSGDTPKSVNEDDTSVNSEEDSCEGLKTGQKVKVFISYLDSPSRFWSRKVTDDIKLDKIKKEMEERCEQDTPVTELHIKKLCAAKYGAAENTDGKEVGEWYRGEIDSLDPNNSRANVTFIDYGTTESVAVADIRELPKDLASHKPMAFECLLYNVQSAAGHWTEDSLKRFAKLTMDVEITLEVIMVAVDDLDQTRNCYMVNLISNDVSIGDTLKAEGLAIDGTTRIMRKDSPLESTRIEDSSLLESKANIDFSDLSIMDSSAKYSYTKLPMKAKVKATVCHGDSPNLFWVQPENSSKKLQDLEEKVEEFCESQTSNPASLSNLGRGDPCLVKSVEFEKWYRACVLNREGTDVEVAYIDYGNQEMVTIDQILPVNGNLMQLPAMGVQCSLAKIRPSKNHEEWSQEAIDFFLEQVLEREFVVECEFKDKSDTYRVLLLDMGMSIAQKLVDHGFAECSPSLHFDDDDDEDMMNQYRMNSLRRVSATSTESFTAYEGQDLPIGSTVGLSYVEGGIPSNFMCQLTESSPVLESMMESIADHCSSPVTAAKVKSLNIGQPCLVQNPKDKGWYRGSVVGLLKDMVEVQMIDFGYTKIVERESIQKLNVAFRDLPPQAIPCSLAGVNVDGADEIACQQVLDSLCKNQNLVGKIVDRREDGCFDLELHTDNLMNKPSINQQIIDIGLGTVDEIQDFSTASNILEKGFLEGSQVMADSLNNGEGDSSIQLDKGATESGLEGISQLEEKLNDKDLEFENNIDSGTEPVSKD